MNTIIHLPSTDKLLKKISNSNTSYVLIDFEDKYKPLESELVKLNVNRLPVKDLTEEIKLDFDKNYIESIGLIGKENNSPEWWANPVSEKNEHLSDFYKNLYYFVLLVWTIKSQIGESNKSNNYVIVCKYSLFCNLKEYFSKSDIKFVSHVSKIMVPLWVIKGYLAKALRTLLFLLRLFLKKLHISLTFSRFSPKRGCYLIRTWLDKRFLDKKDIYYDAYFGRLPDFLSKSGKPVVIIAGTSDEYKKVFEQIKIFESNYLFIPEEYYFKYSDFARLLLRLKLKKTKIENRLFFQDIELTPYYEREINMNYNTKEYFVNMIRYFIGKGLAENIDFSHYIQTYENYSWEKMCILGLKENKSDAVIMGFQHAFVSKNSFKYFPGAAEKEIAPLPDKIKTIGEVTKNIMEKYGNYKDNVISAGCALRQENIVNQEAMERKKKNTILVPLTMVRDETIKILNFLYESGIEKTDYQVILRPHPAASIKSIINGNIPIPKNVTFDNKTSAKEQLRNSDILIYTWTTMALEALKLGLSLIYLDILTPLYVDPLFEYPDIRKSVKNPEELIPAIKDIYSKSNDEYIISQKEAQKYLEKYFYPVNNTTMNSFLQV